MTLRPATESDVETLFEIRCSVIENHQSREELADIGITPDSVAEMIRGSGYVAFIAEVEGQAVGLIMAEVSEGYIYACFVRPAFEGRGIGRALMEATEEVLRNRGVKEAWLSTGAGDNLRAIGFYTRMGWVRNGFLDDGQIRFEKKLVP